MSIIKLKLSHKSLIDNVDFLDKANQEALVHAENLCCENDGNNFILPRKSRKYGYVPVKIDWTETNQTVIALEVMNVKNKKDIQKAYKAFSEYLANETIFSRYKKSNSLLVQMKNY